MDQFFVHEQLQQTTNNPASPTLNNNKHEPMDLAEVTAPGVLKSPPGISAVASDVSSLAASKQSPAPSSITCPAPAQSPPKCERSPDFYSPQGKWSRRSGNHSLPSCFDWHMDHKLTVAQNRHFWEIVGDVTEMFGSDNMVQVCEMVADAWNEKHREVLLDWVERCVCLVSRSCSRGMVLLSRQHSCRTHCPT